MQQQTKESGNVWRRAMAAGGSRKNVSLVKSITRVLDDPSQDGGRRRRRKVWNPRAAGLPIDLTASW